MALLDHHLVRHLEKFEAQPTETKKNFPIPVFVRYSGDIESLKNLGLRVTVDAGNNFLSGSIDVANLAALANSPNVVTLRAHERHHLHLNTSVPQIRADVVRTGNPSYTGAGVVVGIADTGIDIFHKNFIKSDGKTSRILWLWDQTLTPTGTQTSPAGFSTGVEFSASDINTALSTPSQPFAHQDKDGHGTHVAGIAAGNGSQGGNCHGANTFWGVAPDADLIIVKCLADDASQSTDTVEAFKYILQKAAPKPVVVNYSAGSGMGPHDTHGDEDVAVDALFTGAPGQVLVVSAGNSGGIGDTDDFKNGIYHSGFHAVRKPIAAKATSAIPIMVPPDYSGVLDFDIWYSGMGILQMTLIPPPPLPNTMTAISPPNSFKNTAVGGCTLSGSSNIALPQGKSRIRGTLTPPSGGNLPKGLWTVSLTENIGAPVDELHLWIDQQDAYNQPVLSFPDRVQANTIESPGSAKSGITVGSCGSQDGKLADSSSRGPTLALPVDYRQKPDICAPGLENSPSEGIMAPKAKAEGGCCCDCCYDYYVDKQGTSMSAPHVTGVVALMLQKNGQLTAEQIRTTLATYPQKNPSMGTLPNNDWGNGEVDAELAVTNIPLGPHAIGGGGGGGGGSISSFDETGLAAGPFPPLASSFSPHSMRIATRLRDLAIRGKDVPAAQLIVALVSKHFDEVLRLIRSNRRVATRWHRMFGPELIRFMLTTKASEQIRPAPIIPAVLNNQNVGERISALFDVLFRYGSTRLCKDINLYGPLFVALPGATFSGLFSLPNPETHHGAGRHP